MGETTQAGLELDAEVAEKVMGYQIMWHGHPENKTLYIGGDCERIPAYSAEIAAAFEVVTAIQRAHPGWRFSLLGGDVGMGYQADARGEWLRDAERNLIVDEASREPFGWHARFFGELDPRENYGDTHGDARAETPAHATCLAALAAVARSSAPTPQEGTPHG